MQRFLSKRTYQTLAVVLLAVCALLLIVWALTGAGLFGYFEQTLGSAGWAAFWTFMALSATWMVIVIPMRQVSQMPSLREELGADVHDLSSFAGAFRRSYTGEQAENERLFRTTPEDYTPDQAVRVRRNGWIYAGVGLGIALAVTVSLVITLEDDIWTLHQVVALGTSVAFFGGGVAQLIRGESIIRKK
ncbi:MAG: hypothetical protein JXB35_17070 [Anaerolineae bacterium]|nr:hypothetical protein [Anaerolineae bacterium]